MNVMKKDSLLDNLKSEHREVEELLNQAEKAPPSQRTKLISEIEKNLVSHARAEEKTVYSLFYANEKSDKSDADNESLNLINEAYEEHHIVDHLLSVLKKIDVRDEAWVAKLKVLKENVTHHVEEEEQELFKKYSGVVFLG
ncbi:MAG: hemerythrin domain-containing protein [Oligoflexus sp.]